MNQEEFRNVKIGDKVKTKNGGIGFVAKRLFKQVEITCWETPTPADYAHCSYYMIEEIVEIVN